MIYEMKLKDKYFNLIKNGKKIYEIRLNDEKRQQINVGDIIVFKKESNLVEKIDTIVNDLIHFKSFEEMAKTLPLEKVGFSSKTVEEVVEIYHEFYSEEDEKKYGIVAIKVNVLK